MAFDWNPYKSVIRDLYLIQGKKLPQVVDYMEEHYRLGKKKDAYGHVIRQWGFKKNARSKDWKIIHGKIKRRQPDKPTDIYREGRLVGKQELAKAARHYFPTPMEQYGSAPSPMTPEGYTICTPMAVDSPPIFMYNLPSVQVFGDLLSLFRFNQDQNKSELACLCRDLSFQLLTSNSMLALSEQSRQMSMRIASNQTKTSESSIEILSVFRTAKLYERLTEYLPGDMVRASLPVILCVMMRSIVNSKLNGYEAEAVTRYFLSSGGKGSLDMLLRMDLPAAKELIKVLIWGAIRLSDLAMLDVLLRKSGRNIDAPINRDQQTALEVSVLRENVKAVRLILANGANPDLLHQPDASESHLIYAAWVGNVSLVRALLQSGANVNMRLERGPIETALQAAIEDGFDEVIHALLEAGALIDTIVARRIKALDMAIKERNMGFVKFFLRHGPNSGCLLRQAARKGSESMFHASLKYAGGFETVDIEVLLECAVAGANGQIVKFILKHGVNISGTDALTTAVRHGSGDLIWLLLRHGADINAPAGKDTPLQAAASRGHIDVVQLLLSLGADVNAPAGKDTPLQAAASWGHIDVLQLLLSYGAEVDTPAGGWTALQAAVRMGHIDIVRLLLDRGADVNVVATGELEYTVLHNAARSPVNSLQLAQLLIGYGAMVDKVPPQESEDACTALQLAIREEKNDVARLLHEHEADINAPCTLFGTTSPLGLAILSRDRVRLAMVRCVISWGGRVRPLGPGDLRVLRCKDTDFDVLVAMLEAGLDVDQRAYQYESDLDLESALGEDFDYDDYKDDSIGWTLLQKASGNGTERVIHLLLEQGADVNAAPDTILGRTALQAAAETAGVRTVRLLLERNANINDEAGFNGGVTALQAAALSGSFETVVLLLERGADVNAPAAVLNGRTALEAAAEHGHLDIVQLLLNVGAQIEGTDAVKYATEHGYDGVVMLLQKHCA